MLYKMYLKIILTSYDECFYEMSKTSRYKPLQSNHSELLKEVGMFFLIS